MKILVTGATGFVGREVVRQLFEAGHAITILARHPDSSKVRSLQAEYGLEVRRGDVLQAEGLAQALRPADAVIHLVGIISQRGASTFENVHVRGTQNVLLAAKQAGVGRFIQMSALGTRPNAAARYHQTKWEAEEEVRKSGLDYTIFRPSLIFGRNDHFVNLFARVSRFSPFLPVIGNGQTRFAPVAVKVVGSAFARCLTQSASSGLTLDLCGPERLSFNEMLDEILQALGRKRLKWHIPVPLARLQAAILEMIFPKLFRRPPPLNRDQILMLQEDNVGNGEPANRLLGLVPVTFGEGIRSFLGKGQA